MRREGSLQAGPSRLSPSSHRPADLETLLTDFIESGRSEGGFEAGVEKTHWRRILVGPEFLFRVESEPENVTPGTAYRISDLELASRLSFFLWSSIPDNELLGLAEKWQAERSCGAGGAGPAHAG